MAAAWRGVMAALMVHFGAFLRALRAFLGPKPQKRLFMKTLQGFLQSLSIPLYLSTLPESSAQEYSSVAQDWALFLHFMTDFMGILGLFEGLFQGSRRASEP